MLIFISRWQWWRNFMHAVVQCWINLPLPNQRCVCMPRIWVQLKVSFFRVQYQSSWRVIVLGPEIQPVLEFNSSNPPPTPQTPPLVFAEKVTYNVSDNPWNHYNNPSFFFHAPCFHLHIWMTRPAGLFNHRELLGCTIAEVVFFCFSVLL